MKKALVGMFLLAIIGFFAAAAVAQMLKPAKHAGVEATADPEGNYTIPSLPNGQLVDVEIYNDRDGTPVRRIGPQSHGKLNPCDGFNFTWKDAGGIQFHLITRGTKPGGSLETDCSWKDDRGIPRCKYLYTGGQSCKE